MDGLVLQHDWLLTTACLGDSRAVLDTGTTVVILTEDHRVATHKPERRRLEKKGSIVAPVDMNGTERMTDLMIDHVSFAGLFVTQLSCGHHTKAPAACNAMTI
jgi:hypothetical protein